MKILKRLFITAFICLTIGGVFLYSLINQINTPLTLSTPKEIIIPKGASLNQTANILVQNHIIKSSNLFLLYTRFNKLASQIKAGEYRFENSNSIKDITNILTRGDVINRTITIPEGKALVEILDIINSHPHLSGKISIPLKEGDILPETYHFTKGTSRDEIIQKSKLAMENALDKAYKDLPLNSPLKTKEDILILASIIEKETGLKSERELVSSVFTNRLKIGMRLQTDPTIIYAVTNGKMNLNRPIYKKDLNYNSPYNTYIYSGLPPTPICSPGLDSIRAAINPKDTKYLYFVADGITGGHRFASSLAEHNKNVVLYKKALKK